VPTIEKGVPLPKPKRGPGSLFFTWNEMEVGDSVFFADQAVGPVYRSTRDYSMRKTQGAKKFTCRKEGDGCRVWRIE
jgi:hypothetical protein